jgi:hypothetical protein
LGLRIAALFDSPFNGANTTQMLFQCFFRVSIRSIDWLDCFPQVMEVAQLMWYIRNAA